MTLSLDLTSIAFFGRSFDEYLAMFALDPAALADKRIADVASGPSSFAAEAAVSGIPVIAVDPMYGLPADTLAAHIQLEYDRMFAQMRGKADLFRFHHFASIGDAERSRRSAAARFLADYETGFVQGRYVGAALPHLPFPDGSFDLVLCAHLLFLYASRFDYAWHLAACRELLRISSEEVRIHPLCGLDGNTYADIDQLINDLRRVGIAARVEPLAYEFFKGSNQMLVLAPSPNNLSPQAELG